MHSPHEQRARFWRCPRAPAAQSLLFQRPYLDWGVFGNVGLQEVAMTAKEAEMVVMVFPFKFHEPCS